jgi:UDP-N-acetylmuramyl pentapeptide phosphotransferase/UDP-N-acetylglucosamine-1-phosphate transferase
VDYRRPVVIVVAVIAGFLAAAAAWVLLTPAFAVETFRRENFRGRSLPTAAGVILALVVVLADALVAVIDAAGTEPDPALLGGLRVMTLVAVGFSFLGLLDDLGGVGQSGGFKGHLKQLAKGELTTGAAKLFGGAALGIIAATAVSGQQLGWLLIDGALIALSANLANLLDRAPGRVTKVSLLLGAILLAATGFDMALFGVALVLGAGAGLLLPDLRERLMLGDAGANVLGAALGLGVVLTCSDTVVLIVLAVVVALNVASEFVSFSKVINSTGPLKAVDQLGRQP